MYRYIIAYAMLSATLIIENITMWSLWEVKLLFTFIVAIALIAKDKKN